MIHKIIAWTMLGISIIFGGAVLTLMGVLLYAQGKLDDFAMSIGAVIFVLVWIITMIHFFDKGKEDKDGRSKENSE